MPAADDGHLAPSDLEQLFELQPRATLLLMESLPTLGVGRSRLVDREALLALLAKVQVAEDPGAVLAQAREQQSRPKRSLRNYLPHELPPAQWDALPANLSLVPGKLEIAFHSVEELASALVQLASLLQDEFEEFEKRYTPQHSQNVSLEAEPMPGVEYFSEKPLEN